MTIEELHAAVESVVDSLLEQAWQKNIPQPWTITISDSDMEELQEFSVGITEGDSYDEIKARRLALPQGPTGQVDVNLPPTQEELDAVQIHPNTLRSAVPDLEVRMPFMYLRVMLMGGNRLFLSEDIWA